MQLTRCPVCHSRIGLEQCTQDEAGRELLAILAKQDTLTGSALVAYLGLFRSPNRDLSNDRALKLANEVLALADTYRLTSCLAHTVESLRAKRQEQHAQGMSIKPLSNHNYLKKVLESTPETQAVQYIETDNTYTSAAASAQRLNDTSWAE